MTNPRRLWLIDAGYLFRAQRTVQSDYFFDYRRLRERLEADTPIGDAYYFNSAATPPNEKQTQFHEWLELPPPDGPNIRTKLYGIKPLSASTAY